LHYGRLADLTCNMQVRLADWIFGREKWGVDAFRCGNV
jgi:hypothetical protein